MNFNQKTIKHQFRNPYDTQGMNGSTVNIDYTTGDFYLTREGYVVVQTDGNTLDATLRFLVNNNYNLIAMLPDGFNAKLENGYLILERL